MRVTAVKTEPKTRLERGFVIHTALELADREGPDALTIRRLASELAVTPMALYWHFEDKQALLDALSDHIWDDARDEFERVATDGDIDDWNRIRQLIGVLVNAFRRHPTLAPRAPTRVTECESGLVLTELTLGVLARIGLEPERATEVAWFLLSAAVMLVSNQPGLSIPDLAARDNVMRSKRARLMSLPPERYPHIVACTDYLVSCDAPELYYELGVNLIVGGMRAALSPVG
jgi:AcrR family transcriptional regulator